MRTEREMLDLILGLAYRDERIRAVYMNGSRTNPNVPKDIFSDYDIVYVVTETASFIKDETWLNELGERLMMQMPDQHDQSIGLDVDISQSFAYLMLFTDGNRIDLQIKSRERVIEEYVKDKLTVPLLDKDGLLPVISAPTDLDYHVQKPREPLYISCCNDFWWCLQNVAKGIWRGELPYAKQMFEQVIRSRLDEMVSWWIGMHHDFQVSIGKMGKYIERYLPVDYWEKYKLTYSDSSKDQIWHSIFTACELFRRLAKEVAAHFKYTYVLKEDENMTQYLRHVMTLPANAKGVYE